MPNYNFRVMDYPTTVNKGSRGNNRYFCVVESLWISIRCEHEMCADQVPVLQPRERLILDKVKYCGPYWLNHAHIEPHQEVVVELVRMGLIRVYDGNIYITQLGKQT